MSTTPSAPPPAPALACRVASRLDVIGGLAEQVDAWAENAGVPGAEALRLELMLDELITNIVSHGYLGRDDGWIELRLERLADGVWMTIEDGAAPFDPTQAETEGTAYEGDLADRPIGGLGISLVRQLAAAWHYERSERGNRSRILRRWGAEE